MATNSLPSQIVTMGTVPHSVAMVTTAGAARVLSSSSADHTVAPITPSHGRGNRSMTFMYEIPAAACTHVQVQPRTPALSAPLEWVWV